MDKFLSKGMLERHKKELVPAVFTEIQLKVLKKYLEKKKLTAVEKKYLYSSINKKLKAMKLLWGVPEEKVFVSGSEFMIESRRKKAAEIIKRFSKNHKNQKILIGGGFLWKKKYNDIDLFIISKYNKEAYTNGRLHINYLPADAENSLFFASLSQICISNFQILKKTDFSDVKDLTKLIDSYELLVILILQKSSHKQELRNFVLDCFYSMNKTVLNSFQLSEVVRKIEMSGIKLINHLLIETLSIGFKQTRLRKKLKRYISSNNKLIKGHKFNNNFKIYNQAYKEAIEIGS